MIQIVLKLLGIAILIFTTAGVFFAAPSGNVHKYILIHLPSAVFILGGTLGVLLVWKPAREWRVFLAFVNRHRPHSIRLLGERRKRSLAGFLTAGGRAALLAGLGGELLGAVMILVSDGNPAAMEPGISLACVSLIYGLLLSELVFRPLRKLAAPDAGIVRLGGEAASGVVRAHYSYSRPSMSTSASGDRSAGSPV